MGHLARIQNFYQHLERRSVVCVRSSLGPFGPQWGIGPRCPVHAPCIPKGDVPLVNVLSVFRLQNLSNVNFDTNTSKYGFWTRRIQFNYSEGNNKINTEKYVIIQSLAKPNSPRFIKSSRSGKVSLSVNWKNCGSWIEIV